MAGVNLGKDFVVENQNGQRHEDRKWWLDMWGTTRMGPNQALQDGPVSAWAPLLQALPTLAAFCPRPPWAETQRGCRKKKQPCGHLPLKPQVSRPGPDFPCVGSPGTRAPDQHQDAPHGPYLQRYS